MQCEGAEGGQQQAYAVGVEEEVVVVSAGCGGVWALVVVLVVVRVLA